MPASATRRWSFTASDPFEFEGEASPALWSFFAQDSWQAAPRVTLSGGLRFDRSELLLDRTQWSPRVGAAVRVSARQCCAPQRAGSFSRRSRKTCCSRRRLKRGSCRRSPSATTRAVRISSPNGSGAARPASSSRSDARRGWTWHTGIAASRTSRHWRALGEVCRIKAERSGQRTTIRDAPADSRQPLGHPGEIKLVTLPLERHGRWSDTEAEHEALAALRDDSFRHERERASNRRMTGHRQFLTRRENPHPDVGIGRLGERMKVLSEKFISRAIPCISSGVRPAGSGNTAS